MSKVALLVGMASLAVVWGTRATTTSRYWPTWGSVGEVCVERYEDSGFYNLVPVRFSIGTKAADVQLFYGGISDCAYLPAGTYPVRLTWIWDPRNFAHKVYSVVGPNINLHIHQLIILNICMPPGHSGESPAWKIVNNGQCARHSK